MELDLLTEFNTHILYKKGPFLTPSRYHHCHPNNVPKRLITLLGQIQIDYLTDEHKQTLKRIIHTFHPYNTE